MRFFVLQKRALVAPYFADKMMNSTIHLSINDLERHYTNICNKNEEKMEGKREKYETSCFKSFQITFFNKNIDIGRIFNTLSTLKLVNCNK